ncbi:Phage-related baseplate assembly protein V [Neorhizobium galegae bv. officinalis]|nr:Phage-related baseplate assembly protein V [Neorhizobium galegae bv. officinalis]
MIPKDLPGQIADLYHRIAEVERRGRNRKRTGTIAEVDLEKGLYRVELSKQSGKPYLTGWLKTRQMGAGGVKIDVLLSKGEQVDVVSESGDLTDAQIDLSTYSAENARENSDTPFHIKIGDTVIAVSGSSAIITAEDIRLEGNVRIVGAILTHNDRDIGHQHQHKDVRAGPNLTGPPKE